MANVYTGGYNALEWILVDTNHYNVNKFNYNKQIQW